MLKTILIDPDASHLSFLSKLCEQSGKTNVIGMFTNPAEAVEFSEANVPDFAFLEYNYPDTNGGVLGNRLRKINPDIILIYITDNYGASEQIIRAEADFCIFKPYSPSYIFKGINKACLLSKKSEEKEIYIRTFGRFDVFVDKRIIYFSNKKSKELLALCVDNKGGEVTMEMAIDALWPEKEYDDKAKRLYRKAVSALQNVLSQVSDVEFFEHSRGSCHICVKKVKCDYYEYLKNPKSMYIDPDVGYMFQYSWAEETAAKIYFRQNLNSFKEKIHI